jgi:hypothetical protein
MFTPRRQRLLLLRSKPLANRRSLLWLVWLAGRDRRRYLAISCCPPSISYEAPVMAVLLMMRTARAAMSSEPTTRPINHEAAATLFFRRAMALRQGRKGVIFRPGEPLWKTLPA